jgi:hypothetical protein
MQRRYYGCLVSAGFWAVMVALLFIIGWLTMLYWALKDQ